MKSYYKPQRVTSTQVIVNKGGGGIEVGGVGGVGGENEEDEEEQEEGE